MRRRALLATASGAVAAGLAGCTRGWSGVGTDSPADTVSSVGPGTTTRDHCGQVETWTGIECEVSPTGIRRDSATGGYRIDCEIAVQFDYPDEDTGFDDALLAGYDADGRLLSAVPLSRIAWRNVPEWNRRTDDCGYQHGALSRTATLPTPALPSQIGLSFVQYSADEGTVYHAAVEGTPTDADASQYERLTSGADGFRRSPSVGDDASLSIHALGLETARLDDAPAFDPALREAGANGATIEWTRPDPPACRGPVVTGVDYDGTAGDLIVSFRSRDGDDGCDAPGVRRTLRIRHTGEGDLQRYVLRFEEASVRLPAPSAA